MKFNVGYMNDQEKKALTLAHGKIDSLPFGGDTSLFALCAFSKVAISEEPEYPNSTVFLDCQFIEDEEPSLFPMVKQREDSPNWTEMNIVYLPDSEHNQELLTKYDLYWKAGYRVPKTN